MRSSSTLFPELSFGNDRNRIRPSEAVCAVARRLWPVKTAANLACRAGVTMRAAEMWLEGRNDISGDALVQLMRSDIGYELMQALMVGTKSRWWRDFERGVRISQLEEKIEWQAGELAKLKAGFAV